MPHPVIEAMVGVLAAGSHCDFEDCPGRTNRAKKKLIWHQKYLFVHNQCVPGARAAAHKRGEMFGFRNGL